MRVWALILENFSKRFEWKGFQNSNFFGEDSKETNKNATPNYLNIKNYQNQDKIRWRMLELKEKQ